MSIQFTTSTVVKRQARGIVYHVTSIICVTWSGGDDDYVIEYAKLRRIVRCIVDSEVYCG